MRYLRLYLHFVRFSLSRALEFRFDFYFRIVMDVVFYATQLAFFTVLYGQTRELGGWSLDQIYLFATGYFVVDALFMTVFANNVWWLPILVNKGDLDYHLVRPVSSLFFVSLRDFAANSLINLVIAGGLLGWAVARYPEPLGAGRVILFVLFLLLGAWLLYLVRLLFVLPVFWTHSGHGLLEVSWALTFLGERPVEIYHPWLRALLLTVLPLGFVASVPVSVLFSGWTLAGLAHAGLVTAGMTALTLWLWRRALAAYASASS
ncbi:MAG TPA: ABC-2 family transporter protein [Thermoanaerobaculia bacterium]|nr:ABC-2 family transporter protein [Thermoanaerobaculia bacterium]